LRSVRSVLAAAAIVGGLASAQPVLAPDTGAAIGRRLDLSRFVDERGAPFTSDGGPTPWIVSPVYARCRSTCSPLTAALKRALAESGAADARVVSFSFDPDERPEDLAAFRARLALPPRWLTLRATDGAALDAALATLDFRTIALADGQLDHPNLVVVLTPDMRLSEYLFGVDVTGRELAAALARARAGGAGRGAWRATLFTLAALGFAASAFVFVSRMVRRRR
jgi:cytochrome oxidase Cu insertion factor (SCO1/SenC/PrrC family)